MTSPEEEQGIIPGQLDLKTLVDLPDIGVMVDDVYYLYSPHWRWSLIERSRFGSFYADLIGIERKPNPTDKDLKKFQDLQHALLHIICPDMPEEVMVKLPSDAQRSAIIVDFLTKSGSQATTLIPKEHAAMLALLGTMRTGDQPSPASRRPTAVTPIRG